MFSEGQKFLRKSYPKIIEKVKAPALYKKYLHLWNNTLFYRNTALDIHPQTKLYLAGSGKASLLMAESLMEYLALPIQASLFISPLDAPQSQFTVLKGNHPVPGEDSLKAGKKMYNFLKDLKDSDTLIYFLSGGSSALFEFPLDNITLNDLKILNKSCLASGANIHEINTLRSAISAVKGGKLASLCKAKIYVFVLSDVMGNDLSIIGSGPFYSRKNALSSQHIIKKYQLAKKLSPNVLKLLSQDISQDNHPAVPHFLIGTNMELLEAAEELCMNANIKAIIYPETLFGEAKESGEMIAQMIKIYKSSKPVCLIFGGENTVSLNTSPGQGGRAQELALSVLNELQDTCEYALLAAGSDGIDGVGGAAGAIVDQDTFLKAQELDLSPSDYLKVHDSYNFFKKCDALIEVGYTGTNVGDIVIAIIP
ncbi:MAG: DUF4147 domain-containing protein [Candidatus Neomarinimicrobiota bacterium]